jgi:hypothetical protein
MTNSSTPRTRLKKVTLAVALATALMSSMAGPAMARDFDHDGDHDRGRHRGWEHRREPHYRGIDDRRWHEGRWMHTRYNGRYGWWWVVGNDWRYYNAPVYPYPVNPYASEVIYAPPVVVEPPPEPPSGINFVFPIHIR